MHATVKMYLAIVLIGCSLLTGTAWAEKTVFMVLWRGETRVEEGFRAYFAETSHDLNIIVRSVDRDKSRLPAIIEEIKSVQPDLVYTWGTSVTLGIAGQDPSLSNLKHPSQLTDIPIVFTMVSQPVKSGVVRAFGPTGRNVSGVSHIVPVESQLNAMQAYMPIDRIAVIFTPTESNSVLATEQLVSHGNRQNIRVDTFPVPLDDEGNPRPDSLPSLVYLVSQGGPQFLYLGPDSFIAENVSDITDQANQYGLPSFAATEIMLTRSDALYGLVAKYNEVGRFTASKVEQILFEGKAASEVPVEVLPEFSYQIRADVARSLKIYPNLFLMDYAEIINR
ncbi:MAG: ABC transporter substrate-binding protein [Gammaproteobacteria bacterium]|nr:ABC transporter substrate-binding protein [Gammaproteobacteria bacterium]MCY4228898.1 ABC transporter substrate-binding protein [Gammaproteobacteria bacterium]